MRKFLETEISDIEAGCIKVIEWRPSLNLYGEAYVKLLSLAVEFIKRTDAVNRTTAAFGKKWVRNFFRNLKLLNKSVLYRQTEIPVIVTGSGPSLEQTLPVIKEAQDCCLIIAASSSLMALSAGGVAADIVIATDGGNWALRHLYPLCRAPGDSVLALNLSAALPSQCADIGRLIINDGSFWQSIVLHEIGAPSVIIGQKGTVTASAVELALVLSTGNIYLAGMDLGVKDIRTHARPYGFDNLFSEKACRFSPVYSTSFSRSRLIKEGGSMDIYAAWFKNQTALWPKRIFSLGEAGGIFESVSLPRQKTKKPREILKSFSIGDGPESFCERGGAALLDAMKNPKYAENLKRELTPLLFPGENKATEEELEKAIKEAYEQHT